jgi:hypothetical protein
MIWAKLDKNRNFKLESNPKEWPYALEALGISEGNKMAYMTYLDTDIDGAISMQVENLDQLAFYGACLTVLTSVVPKHILTHYVCTLQVSCV